MLKVDWLALITFGGILALGWIAVSSQTVGPLEHQYAVCQAREAQSRAVPSKANEPIASVPIGASTADVDSCRREWREEKDLQAQREMAFWAMLMFIATALAVFLIWKTYEQTTEVLSEARDATDAANRTVDETKRIGELQTRAYVIASGLRVDGLWPNSVALFSVTAINCGATPAQNVQIRTAIFVADSDPNRCKIFFGKLGHISSQVLGPSQTTVGKAYTKSPIEQPLLTAIVKGELQFVFVGYISYRDIFGKTRRTVFRAFLERSEFSDGKGILTLASRNNRAN